MRILIALLVLFAVASGEQYVIEHPGVGGLNNYHGDGYLLPNEARELVNFDIIDGDLVKRPGFAKVYTSGDTGFCDGLTSYYSVDGEARLLRVFFDKDTALIYFSNPNSYTFPADSFIRFYGYKSPVFGYDWVHFEDAIFIVNGKNQPTIFHADKRGMLSMPTPGAPTAAVLNVAGNLNGTYSYRLHFFATADTTKKSFPGPQSAYVFADNEKVILWNFPPRMIQNDTTTAHVIITRNKNNDENYYVLDTISYSADMIYIDNTADGSLGGIMDTNTADYEDSIQVPGQPHTQMPPCTLGVGCAPYYAHWEDEVLPVDSDYYYAYSFYDTINKIESEIGPFTDAIYPVGDTQGVQLTMIGPARAEDFVDCLILYISNYSDTTRLRPLDTINYNEYYLSAYEDGLIQSTSERIDSTDLWSRPVLGYQITNKIPYKYMVHSHDRLWAAGDEDYPSRLYYSGRTDTNGLGYWDMTFDYLSLDENDGDKIMGLVTDENGVVPYKSHSIWYITGTDPEYDMRSQKIVIGVGAVNNNVIVRNGQTDYFLSVEGEVCRRQGYKVDTISAKIRNSLNYLSIDTLSSAVMTFYKGELWLRVNDSVFVCNLDGQPKWRKYDFVPRYFAFYDTTTSRYYAKKEDLIFVRNDLGDIGEALAHYANIYSYDFNDTCTTDDGESIAVYYKSGPFLQNAYFEVLGGYIIADIPYEDTVWLSLLSINNDTISTIYLTNDSSLIGDFYKFSFDSYANDGHHLYLTDRGSCASLRIKKIALDYRFISQR